MKKLIPMALCIISMSAQAHFVFQKDPRAAFAPAQRIERIGIDTLDGYVYNSTPQQQSETTVPSPAQVLPLPAPSQTTQAQAAPAPAAYMDTAPPPVGIAKTADGVYGNFTETKDTAGSVWPDKWPKKVAKLEVAGNLYPTRTAALVKIFQLTQRHGARARYTVTGGTDSARAEVRDALMREEIPLRRIKVDDTSSDQQVSVIAGRF